MALLVRLLVTCLLLREATATCYFPDGNVSSLDVACNPDAVDSFCCYSHQACLSNKLCLTGVEDGVNQYARGTCTDHTWQSGACPDFCLDQQALGNPVMSCNVTGSDSYCCNYDCSCDSGTEDEVLSFTGTPYTISVIGVTSTYPNPSASTQSPSTTTSTSSVSTTTSTSSVTPTTASPTTENGPVGSSTVNAAGAAATSSAASVPQSDGKKGGSNSTAIGVGVGVGVGVALLLGGAAAFFLYRRHSRSRSRAPVQQDAMPAFDKSANDYSGHGTSPTSQPSPYNAPSLDPKQPFLGKPALSNPSVSELDSRGHGYSELHAQTDRTDDTPGGSDSGVAELP
ncbi:hypothetical protein A1O3_05286 [Capronia epimyces CBS 606.96]|uniref:Mid2 domain-containing protein n=1 Tax=Capronia epimyces CBS 606.96 TaxID=1182542 RepID=W9Y5W7_9EURO|nr:uncharacterized protein A1O3_05286 [Capronia epimyces CBS 606.96]EXJ84616.1 hypothetical protein A1O3_05286 [Capronia epimyces CBS 606.96]